MERLELPVISVGSLCAGGAGKTPFVMALGEALRRAGVGFDVLSRGYGRTVDAQAAKRVVGTGFAEEFGDEPLMIARRLGRRVYVAAERAAAGRMAEREYRAQRETGPWVHLLDDGFQHRRLARAVDIVLLTKTDVQDALLPAGDLREPLKSLRRADVVVLRKDEAAELRPVVERVVASAKKKPMVWEMERGFHFVEGVAPVSSPLAFCGIARPEAFLQSLRGSGAEPASFVALKDHQRYDDGVVQKLVQAAERVKANGFVTTAKDAVKLSPAMLAMLQRIGPVVVGDIEVTICDETRFISALLRLLSESSSFSS